jgi:hypothetical protein
MTGAQTLIARAAMGSFFALAGIALASSEHLLNLPERRFNRVVIVGMAALRLGMYALVFLVLRIPPRGDVQSYYMSQAEDALAHRLIYRDFDSSYAPLHPYLDGGLLALWHSPLVMILLAIVVEIVAMPLWMLIGRTFVAERSLRVAALLYVVSPISLQYVTIDGQDNVLIASALALALFLVLRHREFLAGIAVAASIAITKFLPLLYVPLFFLASPRRWRFVAGLSVVVLGVYGAFAVMGAPILEALTDEAKRRSAGNLGYVFEAAFGVSLPNLVLNGLALGSIVLILALIVRSALVARNLPQSLLITYGVAALTLTLTLFAKKSWPAYMMLALFPLCLLVTRGAARWKLIVFMLFEVVAVTEHSIWSTTLHQMSSIGLRPLLIAHQPVAALFGLVELLLLGGYGWLLVEALSELLAAGRSDEMERLPGLR